MKPDARSDDRCAESLTIIISARSQCWAATAGAFLLVVWVATKALFVFLQESPIP